jgi:hypothetical protein
MAGSVDDDVFLADEVLPRLGSVNSLRQAGHLGMEQ